MSSECEAAASVIKQKRVYLHLIHRYIIERCSVLLMIWSVQQECSFHSTLHIANSQRLSLFLLLMLWIKKFMHLHLAREFKTSLPILLLAANLFRLSALSFIISCYATWIFLWTEWENYSMLSFYLIALSHTHSELSIYHGKCQQPYNHRAKRRKFILKIIHHLVFSFTLLVLV